MSIKVIVIGTLGELVKKIIEFEQRTLEYPENPPLLAEQAAYSKLFEEWPIENRNTVDGCAMGMRVAMSNYKLLEKRIEELLPFQNNSSFDDYFWLAKTMKELFIERDKIKQYMALLNHQGRGAGKPPTLEMEEESDAS